jgi:hypothetical protein
LLDVASFLSLAQREEKMQPHSISRITPTKEEKDSGDGACATSFSLARQGNPTFILRILICEIPLSKVERRHMLAKSSNLVFFCAQVKFILFILYSIWEYFKEVCDFAMQSDFSTVKNKEPLIFQFIHQFQLSLW